MNKEFKHKLKKFLYVLVASGCALLSLSIYLIIKKEYLIGILSGVFSIFFIIGWIHVLGDINLDDK
jgi:hypothetical protein